MEIKYIIGKNKTNYKSLEEKMMEKGVLKRRKCVICTKNQCSTGRNILEEITRINGIDDMKKRKNPENPLPFPENRKKSNTSQTFKIDGIKVIVVTRFVVKTDFCTG